MSGLKGKFHLVFDLKRSHVGCISNKSDYIQERVVVQEMHYYTYNVLVPDNYFLVHKFKFLICYCVEVIRASLVARRCVGVMCRQTLEL